MKNISKVLLAFLITFSISVSADPFKTTVKCIDGYKFAVIYTDRNNSKYVRIVDMEQIMDSGNAMICTVKVAKYVEPEPLPDGYWPETEASTLNVR